MAISSRRKKPRTFSLAEDVVQILESIKSERRLDSLTSALEEVVRDAKKARLAAQVKAYYDMLSDEEVNEEKEWGAFSESQM